MPDFSVALRQRQRAVKALKTLEAREGGSCTPLLVIAASSSSTEIQELQHVSATSPRTDAQRRVCSVPCASDRGGQGNRASFEDPYLCRQGSSHRNAGAYGAKPGRAGPSPPSRTM